MSDLLREIDEDIARDKSEQFLEKWGLSIGVFLVILVGGLLFFFNWQGQAQQRAANQASNFDEGVQLIRSEPEVSTALFTDLTTANSGYANLALFKVGDSLWVEGKFDEAVAAWQAYLALPEANPYLQMSTRLKLAWFGHGILPPEEVETYMDELETRAAYADYVPVLRALAMLEAGDKAGALAQLAQVGNSEDPSLAQNLADAVASLAQTL